MNFHHNPITLQFLGFLNTPDLFPSNNISGYPNFETHEVDLPETADLSLKLPDSLILGKRVEYFFTYYIEHYSQESILLQNHIISREKITLGELDFILQDKLTQKISHVELIFKYYLYDPNIEEEAGRWIGPNRRDTLVRKLDKLKLQQFPLLFREETRDSLEKTTGPVEDIEQKICFKASLFVPPEFLGQELPLINNSAVKGYWIRREAFSEGAYGRYRFFSPKKADWPIDPEYCQTWFTFSEIMELINPILNQQRSPLIWMKKESGSVEQFFVVWW